MRKIEEIKADIEYLKEIDLDDTVIMDCMKELLKYREAERDGRLVVLVCKEGDSVFRITTENVDVDGYRMQYNMQKIIVECKFLHWMSDFIGKTVFLTKEEAEQALRKEDDEK